MEIAPANLADDRIDRQAFAVAARRKPILFDKAIGLAVATVVPAVFWTLIAWGAGHAFGVELSAMTLATIAVVITAYLSLVCSALLATD